MAASCKVFAQGIDALADMQPEAGVEIETEERQNATGGIDQLLVLVRRDAEQQMIGGQLGRVTAQRFGLSDRPFGR